MVTENGTCKVEIEECDGNREKDPVPLDISTSRRTLLSDEKPQKNFNNVFTAIPDRIKFLKFGSASAKFKRLAEERDEVSRSVPSSGSHGIKDRLSGVFARKIDWVSLRNMCKEWIKDPMNMALLLWIFCVAVSGAILFFVMTGMLNNAIPKKSKRDTWFEVNNQILNALFTLMCLYQHPKRIYHFVLLCKWESKDISRLRKIYCKNGTYKPHEWAHMMVVVLLLNLNCFAQYALCGLNWGYRRSERPALGVGVCISLAIAAPAAAGVYLIVSPLGKDYHPGTDEEAQVQISAAEGPEKLRRSFERRYSFASNNEQRIIEERPQWSGGILDFWLDISLAYLSLFCTFCVFGWNMERLGFGNMYVHMATFMLFCMAPFWIFTLAAVNIDNEAVREALTVTGLILCAFGLLYGGFWRIQMRKRFNLPPYMFCFGQPALGDCTLWLCCCWCSLAQEARTGNSYDIVEDKLCLKQINNGSQKPLPPLPRDDGMVQSGSAGPSSPLGNNSSATQINLAAASSPSIVSKAYYSPERPLSTVKEESCEKGKDQTMMPPAPPLIQRGTT